MASVVPNNDRAPLDFAGLMPKVSRALLGEPNPRLSKGPRLRFGAKGSMEVDTEQGWFDDHEANIRGGVLDLIRHKEGCDQAGAFRWLEAKGLKDRTPAALPPAMGKPGSDRVFYDYRDHGGAIAYRVERRGKDAVPPFLQHGPDGKGGFRSARGCMQGVSPLPYRLPELLAADPAAIVFVCEGEKDVDRLAREGLIATTNSGGAGKFSADLVPHFAGRRVAVLADNDQAGEDHARDVEKKLQGVAAAVTVLHLPGLPPKGDVSDWLGQQGAFRNSALDLVSIAEEAFAASISLTDTFPIADLAAWAQHPATPKPFAMAGFVPSREVTLLTGAGGANKSTFGQQLATCAAAGLPMLGIEVHAGPSLYITAEDDDDRLHWMQEHICRALRVQMASLAGKLHLASLRGRLGNELAVFDTEGKIRPAPSYERLKATLKSTRAGLLVLDNVAHLFTGNENDRGQVTAFVNLLYSLCVELGTTVILIGHPNKSFLQGKQEGNATSGSTAWLNAVRSQLLIQRPEGNLDPDARVLTLGKANYARPDQTVPFRWHDFALIRDEDLPEDRRAEVAAVVRDANDNEVFLRCLAERTRQQRSVSEKSGRNLAPVVFATMPEAKGVSKERLERAMDRLFRLNRIERAELWKGADRKPVFGLRECAGNAAGNGAETRCANAGNASAETRATHTPPLQGEYGASPGAFAPYPSDASGDWRENPALGRHRDLSRPVFSDDEEYSTGWGGEDE